MSSFVLWGFKRAFHVFGEKKIPEYLLATCIFFQVYMHNRERGRSEITTSLAAEQTAAPLVRPVLETPTHEHTKNRNQWWREKRGKQKRGNCDSGSESKITLIFFFFSRFFEFFEFLKIFFEI